MGKAFLKNVSLLGAIMFAGTVHATDIDLTNPLGKNPKFGSYSMGYEYSVDGIDLKVTGWSYDNTFNTVTKKSCSGKSCTYKSVTTETVNKSTKEDQVGYWANGVQYIYNSKTKKYEAIELNLGLGIENAASPNHAIDNAKGDYDMLLMSFNQKVSLDSLTAGWIGNCNAKGSSKNGETSVLAYIGQSPLDTNSLKGIEWKDLIGKEDSSWVFVSDSKFSGVGVASSIGNTKSMLSSFWLVGAFNPTFGGNGVAEGYSNGNDFFKLQGLSVSVNPVPLPGSLLLFGTALLGFGTLKRRRKI